MASKRFNEQINSYDIVVDGKTYTINLQEYTTLSRYNHVEHSCLEIYECDTFNTVAEANGRYSWCNRRWDRFMYDRSRREAVEKLPAFLKETVNELIVESKYRELHNDCERVTKVFSQAWKALSPERKENIKNSIGMVETGEQADKLLGLVNLANIIQQQ